MLVFDTTFLLDYLDGVDATADYLAANEAKPFHAVSLSLFEVYRGAAQAGGSDQLETAADGLAWLDALPLTEPAAREAALIEASLLDDGACVNLGDTLIAGVCRHHDARIVTRDDHFDRVPGLDVETY
ncbi:homolog to endonuclease VapC [Halobacterium hubeiense]|jgi:predicted nucleic acid-binding protein|uniref:Ribonuclease VapC n=3 Tax=Halobacterium TaxID=2239 RepID=A0A0U5HU08_9EURY|nr:PIN domain-containing protein [Halobacterium hubeiense]CQH56329.1 homolog to endonuclease VapC [Halobacterium hubeiense]